MSAPVRVRIAPSPTGDPHVGTAYIALFNYVFARKHGGQFVLRIEDTDRTRSTAESEQAILRALKWVGLEWDEGPDKGGPHGPYRQSERAEQYRKAAEDLLQKGAAYRCYCTPERLEALRRQQQAEKRPPGYDRKCRTARAEDHAGEPFVIRLKMPDQAPTFRDELRGDVVTATQVDDQVLLKSDGFPTYHLANVVDDHAMRITHVIRAEEWISSTPKHVVLYQAFGWEAPKWYHMPLLRNKDRSKISKRKNPVSLDYYRDAGFLPEALLNFLGLMGWSFGGDREKFTLQEMIDVFAWDRISLGGPVFDIDKLAWLNFEYLKLLDETTYVRRLREWRLGDEYLRSIVPLVRERVRRWGEFVPYTDFFFAGDLEVAPLVAQVVPKDKTPAEVGKVLEELVDQLDEQRVVFAKEPLMTFLRGYCDKKQWKTKDLFMAVRIGVTGRTAAPPLDDTLIALGKELVRRRLRLLAEALRKQG
jgi:glutamyl-tRNA synthetase